MTDLTTLPLAALGREHARATRDLATARTDEQRAHSALVKAIRDHAEGTWDIDAVELSIRKAISCQIDAEAREKAAKAEWERRRDAYERRTGIRLYASLGWGDTVHAVHEASGPFENLCGALGHACSSAVPTCEACSVAFAAALTETEEA